MIIREEILRDPSLSPTEKLYIAVRESNPTLDKKSIADLIGVPVKTFYNKAERYRELEKYVQTPDL